MLYHVGGIIFKEVADSLNEIVHNGDVFFAEAGVSLAVASASPYRAIICLTFFHTFPNSQYAPTSLLA